MSATPVWLRLDGLVAVTEPHVPVVMPRRFQRRRDEPVVLFDGFSLDVEGGTDVAVVGPPAAAAAVAAIAAGVEAPATGSVRSSHPVVAVLRSRARPLVDQRIRRAIDRELRLRGIRVTDRTVIEQAARLAGVDPDGWTSDLDRYSYRRLAAAAVVCSDAPIVVLETLFTHRPDDFEDRLVARLSERAARGLITVIVLVTERALLGALGGLSLRDVVALPVVDDVVVDREQAGEDDDDDVDDPFDAEDDEVVDDGRTRALDRDVLMAAESLAEMGLQLAVREVRIIQAGAEPSRVMGTQPFRIEIDVETAVPDPSWRVLLAEASSGAVLCRADAAHGPSSGRSVLVLDLPPGMPIGRHVVLVQGRATDEGGRYVFGSRPLATITCKRTLDVPLTKLEAEVSWRT